MIKLATRTDKERIELEMPWSDRRPASTIHQLLTQAKERHGARKALSFQLLSDPKSKAETLTWAEVHDKATQAANLFRSLGVGSNDVVALLLPNSTETAIAILGAQIAGVVCPINPLIDPKQIGRILQVSNARVLVTLKSFPKTNLAQTAGEAAQMCEGLDHILEVDLGRHLAPPKSWLIPLIRPKGPSYGSRSVEDFNTALGRQRSDRLDFADPDENRVAAMFHTGGTTGIPKLTQHRHDGMIYNGWAGTVVGLGSDDVVICPLPLFHVFAAYPLLMSALVTGVHLVLPTPAGYRGDGVFDNFWKLVERWKVSFIAMVPTAAAALMQRPVDADISTLKKAFTGSAAMPLELFRRFEGVAGVEILEGYGLTEATCLVSVNPLHGERKVGSAGLPSPYTKIRILECEADGTVSKECAEGETGEICVSSPGVTPGSAYTDPAKNEGLFADGDWLRTGDLGHLDKDGYLWITGRAKDIIIRGGQNVDPGIIEEALAGHEAVAFVGAIGQPDPRLGEVPCVYLELVAGSSATVEELQDFASSNIKDRLAVPAHVEVLEELPKTAVGKVFKPGLRVRAIGRVLNARLAAEKLGASVDGVVEDPERGLTAMVSTTDPACRDQVAAVLGEYPVRWRFEE